MAEQVNNWYRVEIPNAEKEVQRAEWELKAAQLELSKAEAEMTRRQEQLTYYRVMADLTDEGHKQSEERRTHWKAEAQPLLKLA